jgi:hypothetical protein
MNINYKKSLKLITLLITSLLIATVSATVYYSLTMQSTVTVSSTYVKFINATDTPAGSTVDYSFCTLSLSTLPNSTIIYERAVGVNNTDETNGHYIRLRHVSVAPNGTATVGNFTHIKFYLLDSSNATVATLNYTTNGNNWSVTSDTDWVLLQNLTAMYIKVETLSPATATASNAVTITISVDAQ